MTFEEAYKKSGRIFCITLSSTTRKAPPVLMNHLTSPNVTIASAVLASAAVPFFIPPVRLQYKENGVIKEQVEAFFDGSIKGDIPASELAELFNCRFFIVCQVNVSTRGK
jgi:TAG lipase/steryl ester hydrolase/phospholipase A2/LPA acyltransferase